MNRLISTTFLAVMFSSALFLAGCGGGGAKVEATTTTTTTTMGQELMDIDEAHKRGILSDEEYMKSKKQIMKRYEK